MPTRPLAGIRVLDLSRLIPGPYCSHLLARLGADVIKIETPLAGDWLRLAPPALGYGSAFESLNRGKRSLGLNYRHPEGRAVVMRLAERADVLVESQKPGSLARRGLGPAELRAANPRLIYCSLSGYGQDGPARDEAGHDLGYLARGGLLSFFIDSAGRPVTPGIQVADLAGGMLAATLILGALVARERTGEGAYLDVAIFDAALSWLASLVGDEGDGRPAASTSALSGTLPCYNVYRAADGRYLALAALESPFWAAFCAIAGRPDLVDRHLDPTAVPEVAALIATRSADDWLARADGTNACLVPVNSPSEAGRDGQVASRRAASPVLSSLHEAASPELGRDSTEILAEAGYGAAEIAALEARGIVATTTSARGQATERMARLTERTRSSLMGRGITG